MTEQEIRHALYNGPATRFLKNLVSTDEFRLATTGSVQDSRMAAQELVLRFLAFSMLGIDEYRKNDEMDSFLSDTMQIVNILGSGSEKMRIDSFNGRKIKNKNLSDLLDKFVSAMQRSAELFENCAFRISTPTRLNSTSYSTPINKSLFEVWSVLLGDMPKTQFDALRSKRESLYIKLDDTYQSIRRDIGQDSTKVYGVKRRHEAIGKIVNELVQNEIVIGVVEC